MLGMRICALHGSSPAAFGRRQYAKKTPPPNKPNPPPKRAISIPGCGTPPIPRVGPVARAKRSLCPQPGHGGGLKASRLTQCWHSRHVAEKAFKGFGFCSLASLVMEGRRCHLETPGERETIRGDGGDRERSQSQTRSSAPHRVSPWQRTGWSSGNCQPPGFAAGFQVLQRLA